MNVFEFLGLPANHRSDDKVVHRVKNLSEVPESKLKWPAIAQEKYDGVSAIVLHNGKEWGIFSRTGKRFTNCEVLIKRLERLVPDGSQYVSFCELICPTISLEELSGAVNPNRVEPLSANLEAELIGEALLVCFDSVLIREFIAGKCNESYEFRAKVSPIPKAMRYQVNSIEEFKELAANITKRGGEGAVLKQLDAPWIAGKKDYNYTKLVCGCDFDLEVVAIEEGRGKRKGMVANLILRWRMYGKPDGAVVAIPVDGRFDDTTRIDWWNNPSLIMNKIVHVHALQLGSKGLLRLAKVHEVRIDKTVADL